MNNLLAVNMPLIIDVVGALFVAIFALKGLKKGFGQMFVKTFGTILSLLFAALLCGAVAELLESQFSLVSTVSDKIGGVLTNAFGDTVMNTTLDEVANGKLEELNLSGFLLQIIHLVVDDAGLPPETTLNTVICPTFAYYIVMIISAIVLFIIFKIIFKIIGKIFESLHSITLLAIVDELLGLALGLITGVIYLELIIMAMGVIPVEIIQNVYLNITNTTVVNFIHNIGIFQLIMNAISSVNVVDFVKDVIGGIE